MRANNRIIAAVVLGAWIFAGSGCADEFEARFAEAEALRMQAERAGSEWLETGKLLSEARLEAEQGNREAALKLVERARFEARMAVEQAEAESAAWRERVIR